MKNAKKLIALVAALLVVASMAACTASPAATAAATDKTATAAPTTAGASEAPATTASATSTTTPELITPSFFMLVNSYLYTGDELVFQAIKKFTGIQFKPVPVPLADFNDKLSTLLASNQLPDLVDCRGAKTVYKYGPQGAFVNLTPYIDSGKMPDFKSMLEKYPPAMALSKAPDGNIYGGPRIYDMDFRMDETWVARVDILTKNNITMPKTFDELYNMLKQLKTIYPDSTPYTSRWGISNAMDGVCRFMNTSMTMFVNPETNKIEFGPSNPAYKDALAFIAKCYKDGLLDKDFLTISDEQWTEKFATGKSFVSYDYPQAGDEIIQSNGNQLEAGWDFRTIDQPAYNGKVYGAWVLKGYYGFTKAIASTSKYTDRLVNYINWTYSDEGINALLFGLEGDTYTKDSSGAVKLAADIKYAGNPTGTRTNLGLNDQYIFSVLNIAGRDMYEVAPGSQAAKSYETVRTHKLYAEPTFMPTISNDADNQKYTDLTTPINTYIEEASTKVITGDIALSDWDSVVMAKVNSMGLSDALTMINKAYTEMLGK